MPRKKEVQEREPSKDLKYGNETITRLINVIMKRGKKSLSQRIVFDSLDIIKEKEGKDPLEVFTQAINNAKPILEVKSRRVGGATYQVPVQVREKRQLALASRWLVDFARMRNEHTMSQRLAAEIIDAANGRGATLKKREDVHKMAEANKAFAHYRW